MEDPLVKRSEHPSDGGLGIESDKQMDKTLDKQTDKQMDKQLDIG